MFLILFLYLRHSSYAVDGKRAVEPCALAGPGELGYPWFQMEFNNPTRVHMVKIWGLVPDVPDLPEVEEHVFYVQLRPAGDGIFETKIPPIFGNREGNIFLKIFKLKYSKNGNCDGSLFQFHRLNHKKKYIFCFELCSDHTADTGRLHGKWGDDCNAHSL